MIVILSLACGGNEPAAAIPHEPDPVLSFPGTASLPGEQDFHPLIEADHQAVLLYCWMPMGRYPESEADLHFMASMEDIHITPVPLQFSIEVRNAAQNQLNELGIPMPVALGDDSLREFMNICMLPSAVLVTSEGEVFRATGFGCAERAVRSAR